MADKVILRKGNLFFECPAQDCGLVRVPVVDGQEHKWTWNGSLDKPTLQPSVKITWDFGEPPKFNCCHFMVIEGVIHFQNDCTHELNNQVVPMLDITEEFKQYLGD